MKTIRLMCIGSLALAVFACSSSPSTGGNTGAGEPGSSTNTPTANNAGGSGSGGSSSGSTGTGSSGGQGSTGTPTASGGGGTTGASSSGSSATSSSSSSSSSSGGSASADSGAQDNPDIDYTVAPVTITMSTFTVEAGQEVYYCQTFANPWGKQVDVKTWSLDMGVGSHHMFAFYQDNATDGTIAPCPNGGLQFGPYTFGAQQPKSTVTYPQSVGATIPNGTGFLMDVHYLNTTSGTLTSSVNLTIWVAKPNVVTNHAGAIFLNQTGISVAADCSAPVNPDGCQSTGSYTLQQDVNILGTVSHMHKYATNFVATTSTGLTLYTTTAWSDPPAKNYSPPLQLSAGTTITWTCTDMNTTGQTLVFGESAQSNVMCISTSIFYPVADVTKPVIQNF